MLSMSGNDQQVKPKLPCLSRKPPFSSCSKEVCCCLIGVRCCRFYAHGQCSSPVCLAVPYVLSLNTLTNAASQCHLAHKELVRLHTVGL